MYCWDTGINSSVMICYSIFLKSVWMVRLMVVQFHQEIKACINSIPFLSQASTSKKSCSRHCRWWSSMPSSSGSHRQRSPMHPHLYWRLIEGSFFHFQNRPCSMPLSRDRAWSIKSLRRNVNGSERDGTIAKQNICIYTYITHVWWTDMFKNMIYIYI